MWTQRGLGVTHCRKRAWLSAGVGVGGESDWRARMKPAEADPPAEASGDVACWGGQRPSSEVAEESRVQPPTATETPAAGE